MYTILEKYGQRYVLTESQRPLYQTTGSGHVIVEQPNFLNTGMALAGILKKGESLDNWIKRNKK